MSKPRAAKRKKSYASDDADDEEASNSLLGNLDLGNKSVTPKIVANAIMSLLPSDATKQHASAKKLAKAFPLVMAELDARSNKAARENMQVGSRQPIQFSFSNANDNERKMGSTEGGEVTTINLPEESFVNVLQFLDGREIVNSALVSKVWLSASKNPVVYEDGLDMSRLNLNKKLNMTSLVKLLGCPQFANLKALALPYKVKLGKGSIKQLAKALPHLETFDVGFYSQNAKAKDEDIVSATENFTSLSGLRTDMWNVTSFGIADAVRAMGDQLLDLRIRADTITKNYPSAATMEAITSSCPNLKYFAYRASQTSLYYAPTLDGVRGDSIVALVQACPRLETLELYNTHTHIKRSHFIEIAEIVANDLEAFALRNMVIVGYSGVHPSGTVDDSVKDPFDIRSVLESYTFLHVKTGFEQARLGKGVMFWGINEGPNKGRRGTAGRGVFGTAVWK